MTKLRVGLPKNRGSKPGISTGSEASPLLEYIPTALSLGPKRLGSETDHTLSLSVKVKK